MSRLIYYDTSKNDHGLPYNPFKALTVPRPIGWISTVSKNGIGNLSPYSYFNGLSYDPPFLMFSAGNREDGSKKESVLNFIFEIIFPVGIGKLSVLSILI